MGFELKQGDVCIIQRQYAEGDEVIFRKGDEVKVELISPDPERPGFKYVVASPTLGKKYRLRGADLERKFCPKCGAPLDFKLFKCPKCSWIVPGKEDLAFEDELQRSRDKLFEDRFEQEHRFRGFM